MLPVGRQVLVVRERNVVTAVAEIKFIEIRRILQVSIEHISLVVPHQPRQSRTFEPRLVAFDNVAADGRIPVVVRRVVETEIAQVVTLHLVATELGSEETRLAPALQGSNDHRENRNGNISDIQHDRPGRDGLLRLHHHAASVEEEVLVRRIVTRTEITAGNLNSLVGQAAHLHTVQLLVVLVGGRIIDFADAAFHVVLETHSRKRGVLRLAKDRPATRDKHAVPLVEPDGIRIERRGTVLELRVVVQIESFLFHVVHQIDSVILDGVRSRRVVHPVDLGRVFLDLLALLEFKAGHVLRKGSRSKDRCCKKQNGPQQTMGSKQNHVRANIGIFYSEARHFLVKISKEKPRFLRGLSIKNLLLLITGVAYYFNTANLPEMPKDCSMLTM